MSENDEQSEVENIEETSGSLINRHCSKVILPIAKGKKKGLETLHFKCNYCIKAFVGPSNSFLASKTLMICWNMQKQILLFVHEKLL